jgi:hypothetical protein
VTFDVVKRTSDLERQLVESYGVLIGGDDLRKLLCYQNAAAFRQARRRRALPVPVLSIERRKGVFASAHDIAHWLATVMARSHTSADEPSKSGKEGTPMS